MDRNFTFLFLTCFSFLLIGNLRAQHTFSIVAVDTVTGEIGSAGATCLDAGASIISGIVPGKGALNAQALVCTPENTNLLYGLSLIEQGASAQDVLDSLYANDPCRADDQEYRQYGAVTVDVNGQVQVAAFTGIKPDSFANHIIGPNYAIQGNILLGQMVLDSMEAGFLNTQGSLADKLMAALQGANMVGADTRCASNNTSSAGAYIRVACPPGDTGCSNLYLDAFFLPPQVEPIDTLQALFDQYFSGNPHPAPVHDECETAMPITLAADKGSCMPVEVSLAGARESFVPVPHGDKNLVNSDVWYSFSTGADLPQSGIVIAAEYGSGPDDVLGAGFALYEGCKAFDYYLASRNVADGLDTLLVPGSCLLPNTTYYLRVWSQNNHLYDEGKLRLCVYESDEPAVPNVVWGAQTGEGDFAHGFNGWTTVGVTDSSHVWEWGAHGVISSVLSAFVRSTTLCNGGVGFNSAHYATGGGFVDQFPSGPPPYAKFSGELISPPIDLSDVLSPVLRFTQHFGGLNGNLGSPTGNPRTLRGAMLAVSIDGGSTWQLPFSVNDQYLGNQFSANNDKVSLLLPALGGKPDVRLKFIWDGDFYFWAIDDVMITGTRVTNSRDNLLAEQELQVKIFGNPVDETLEMEISTQKPLTGELFIYNSVGQQLISQPLQLQEIERRSLDVRALPAGVYFLAIKAEGRHGRMLKFMVR